MMMTTFFVGIHGEPGVKRVKVKNAKIMSFCYSVTFACNFTMTELCETTTCTLRSSDMPGRFITEVLLLVIYCQFCHLGLSFESPRCNQ